MSWERAVWARAALAAFLISESAGINIPLGWWHYQFGRISATLASCSIQTIDETGLTEHRTGKRRVVVALRQRKGRTLTFVVRSEADGVHYAHNHLETGTVVYTDEATHWDLLQWRRFVLARINHGEAYSADGICTNQAESYFARLRRMVSGQHHHVSPQYLHQYAGEAAWKEDHRRLDNGALARRAIRLAMAHRRSRNWCGYWQRAA